MRVLLLRICYLYCTGRIRFKLFILFLKLIKHATKFTTAREARQLQRGRHGHRIREEGRRRTDPPREAETLREKTRLQTTVTQGTTTDSALQTTTKGKTTAEAGATETTTQHQ